MRHNYIKPIVKIRQMESESLLAGSPQDVYDEQGGGNQLSRGFGWYDEEEEPMETKNKFNNIWKD